MTTHSWDDEARPLLRSIGAVAEDYRRRMRAPVPAELILPGWSNPTDMTDDEFRATAGAQHARAMGFTTVVWTATYPSAISFTARRIDLAVPVTTEATDSADSECDRASPADPTGRV